MRRTLATSCAFFWLVASAVSTVSADQTIGEREFQRSCSACHGAGGEGDGPLADYLDVPPSDLTKLALRNDGSFPHGRIAELIENGGRFGAHGESAMPVWGDRYAAEAKAPAFDGTPFTLIKGNLYANAKIAALVAYIENLQR